MRGLSSIGIFAGIGGLELGFQRSGIHAELLCELDPHACYVLGRRFPRAKLATDVRSMRSIPKVDVLAAGFPCQDLSQAGRTKGLAGEASGLVSELFRLLRPVRTRPPWIVLENVPFMLHLRHGHAMSAITKSLAKLGYAWAYRVVDSRSFGIPHRRKRVFLVASNSFDPRPVLFGSNHNLDEARIGTSHGFYWTEGNSGIGWAVDAIPALKAGSKVSIPSPPAVWIPESREFFTPDIRDAERLQGFPVDWTGARVADAGSGRRRWALVGNAVTVPVAAWIGSGIAQDRPDYQWNWDAPMQRGSWPTAGWGYDDFRFEVVANEFPNAQHTVPLRSFLRFSGAPLSHRASAGVLSRLLRSSLRIRKAFINDLGAHVKRMARRERVE